MFRFTKPRPSFAEPAQAQPLELKDAQLAAASYGQRMDVDLHDYIRVSPSRVLFVMLDVAGRLGQNRAILSAAQSTFRFCGTELLANDDFNEADAMIEVCVQMNRAIIKAAGRVYACPTFAGCYNETLGTVCYVNAGHTPGFLRDESGVSELRATGLPLGLFSHSAADASIAALRPDAALLVVSRGTIEARSKGKEFGLETVKEILLRATGQSAQEICATLVAKVQGFLAKKPAQDDVTVLALARSAAMKAFATSA